MKRETGFRFQDSRDSVRVEKVMVEVHDTIVETKTITITKNEAGDTTFTSVVTDRLRGRSSDKIAAQTTKTVVKTDTVYVAVRDSTNVESRNYGATEVLQSGGTALHRTLKWVFWIIVAVTVLVATMRISRKMF